MNKWTKLFLNSFLFKEAKTFRLMAQYSKKRRFNLQKVLIFRPLKMDGWINGKKGKKLFEGLEQSSSYAKKMRGCDYEQVDKAVFK